MSSNDFVSKPHVALSVETLPTTLELKQMGLHSIGESVCRPDGLRQLYLVAKTSDAFFIELNVRDGTFPTL